MQRDDLAFLSTVNDRTALLDRDRALAVIGHVDRVSGSRVDREGLRYRTGVVALAGDRSGVIARRSNRRRTPLDRIVRAARKCLAVCGHSDRGQIRLTLLQRGAVAAQGNVVAAERDGRDLEARRGSRAASGSLCRVGTGIDRSVDRAAVRVRVADRHIRRKRTGDGRDLRLAVIDAARSADGQSLFLGAAGHIAARGDHRAGGGVDPVMLVRSNAVLCGRVGSSRKVASAHAVHRHRVRCGIAVVNSARAPDRGVVRTRGQRRAVERNRHGGKRRCAGHAAVAAQADIRVCERRGSDGRRDAAGTARSVVPARVRILHAVVNRVASRVRSHDVAGRSIRAARRQAVLQLIHSGTRIDELLRRARVGQAVDCGRRGDGRRGDRKVLSKRQGVAPALAVGVVAREGNHHRRSVLAAARVDIVHVGNGVVAGINGAAANLNIRYSRLLLRAVIRERFRRKRDRCAVHRLRHDLEGLARRAGVIRRRALCSDYYGRGAGVRVVFVGNAVGAADVIPLQADRRYGRQRRAGILSIGNRDRRARDALGLDGQFRCLGADMAGDTAVNDVVRIGRRDDIGTGIGRYAVCNARRHGRRVAGDAIVHGVAVRYRKT